MGLLDSFFGSSGAGDYGPGETPAATPGLLGNINSWLDNPRNAAKLQAFGEAMMKAGAPSPYKNGWGMALGSGFGAMNQAGNQFDQQEMQKKMQALQLQQLQQSVNQKVDPRSMLGKIDIEKFDPSSISAFLASGDPSKLVALRKKEIAPSGQTYDPYNIPTGANMGAVNFHNFGGQTGMFRPDGSQVGVVQNTMSPDAKASNSLGWANYGLAKENQNMPVVQTGPNGEVFTIDRKAGTGAPVAGPDGQPLTKGEKPLTEFQGKSTTFGMRAAEANQILDTLGTKGVAGSGFKNAMDNAPIVGGVLGPMANLTASKDAQVRDQAERNFVNAVLRQESGAVISPTEFANAVKQYFPRVGDSKEVLANKEQNRKTAIQGFALSAGPGAKNIKRRPITIGGYTIEQVD